LRSLSSSGSTTNLPRLFPRSGPFGIGLPPQQVFLIECDMSGGSDSRSVMVLVVPPYRGPLRNSSPPSPCLLFLAVGDQHVWPRTVTSGHETTRVC
jgi:hypothetical protein